MEQTNEFPSLVSLYLQLRNGLRLDPESFRVPPPPVRRFRPVVRLLDAWKFRGIYFNGTMDGETPHFYFTINPRMARLSVTLTIWWALRADLVPTWDRDKQNLYPRRGHERECLAYLFHPMLAK